MRNASGQTRVCHPERSEGSRKILRFAQDDSANGIFAIVFFCVFLTSCSVGPNFQSPPSPEVHAYTHSQLTKTVGGITKETSSHAQAFVYGQALPAKWWQLFHSREINRLVEKGIANNPNLQSLQATLKEAEETLRATEGSLLFPSFNLALGGARQRFANSTIGGTGTDIFNLFNTSVNVSYVFDVFGGNHRQLEATAAAVDYAHYTMEGAYLSLTANIVTTAMAVASFDKQIRLTDELIHLSEKQLQIMNEQFQLGGVSQSDILSQQNALAALRAQKPPLQKNWFMARHALAVLVGDLPSESQLPVLHLQAIHLPHRLPVSVPSRLVRVRPDIQAQEALLHQASANIGVATANLFPQVSLNSGYGWAATVANQLLSHTAATWSVGAAIAQPLFNGGALLATKRAKVAAFESAYALYRQTVLQAFGNVADSLRALETDARYLRTQEEAEQATKQIWQLTQKQYQLGGVSELAVLASAIQYRQAMLNRVQIEALRYNDTVALFQAVGGGLH